MPSNRRNVSIHVIFRRFPPKFCFIFSKFPAHGFSKALFMKHFAKI